jgi:hypothetical protein
MIPRPSSKEYAMAMGYTVARIICIRVRLGSLNRRFNPVRSRKKIIRLVVTILAKTQKIGIRNLANNPL